MFNWLRNRRRNIFTYWDGERKRCIDPVVPWRIMWEHPSCSPEDDFGPATGIDSTSGESVDYDPEAQDRVLDMTREMFAVRSWAESHPGLTIDETLDLLWSFLRYMGELKKKRDRSLMRLQRMASTSSDPSTTPPESDSSSTSPEPQPDKPQSSSKRSVQL